MFLYPFATYIFIIINGRLHSMFSSLPNKVHIFSDSTHFLFFERQKKPVDGSTYSDDSILPNNELQAELYDDLRVDV